MQKTSSPLFAAIFAGLFLLAACFAQPRTAGANPADTRVSTETQQLRRLFQGQELVPARSGGYIFNAGEPPRIVWRDAEQVRDLGCTQPLRVRWFDADLEEVTTPTRPGRWGAYIEGVAPNGTPLRRSMTFFCRPYGFLGYLPLNTTITLPHLPGPISAENWARHEEEISRTARDLLIRSLNDSEAMAILLAGLSDTLTSPSEAATSEPLHVADASTSESFDPILDSAQARNAEYHLALKIKAQGLEEQVRPLSPPRTRAAGPAAVLREGSSLEAGVRPGTKERIDALCREWAEESKVPFVTLVARRGVIVTHEAFGCEPEGVPIPKDYRADIASLTKSLTSILCLLFVDQGLIDLDAPLGTVLPDYPTTGPHAPTFRQCLTHMSGVNGHGEFGGSRNLHLENVHLNAIDAFEAGRHYAYSSQAYDLLGKALEIRSGKTVQRLFSEQLCEPLGIGNMPVNGCGFGAHPTAWQLGVLGQWILNGGSYGDKEFLSPETFELLLPEDLSLRYPEIRQTYGLGLYWLRDRKPGAPKDSERPEDLYFSLKTLGHGSLTQCLLRVDLENELVIVQIRRAGGERHGEWASRLFEVIAEGVEP